MDLSIIEQAAQLSFDTNIKPLIIKEMKRLKIKKVEQIMGVDFITLNNGKKYSDIEFEGKSESSKTFLEDFIYPLNDGHFYTLINHDIVIK